MEVTINNQKREIPENTNILSLLKLLELETLSTGMAVAVNQQVVPKRDWEATHLRDQDNVLLIRASQGG